MQLVGFVKKEIAVDSAGTTLSYFDAEGPSERVLVCLHGILYRSRKLFSDGRPFALYIALYKLTAPVRCYLCSYL